METLHSREHAESLGITLRTQKAEATMRQIQELAREPGS